VTISVYKSRAEFDEDEDDPAKTVMGFFVPGANRVCTFDPREYGYALSELWSTLFHEASHQFTHLISADLIPGWLNEGTASYFEGARLRSNGSVETNLIPEERLLYLELSLDEGTPELKDVLSYHQPGSYDGAYYPFGWGMVYFLLNYEDAACERVYVPIYLAYMGSYDSGGKHDAFERFVEYFVTKAKQPGIDSFEAFEARWKQWIHELHALHFGPASKADELVVRARKQAAAKKLDAAVESYRWALRKRPGDALAYLELAEVLATQKAEDGALFNYRRALTAARAAADAEAPLGGAGSLTAAQVVERATARITKLDREFGAACSAADGKLLAACVESANAYVEHELPLAALGVLDVAREACGGSAETATLRASIADESGADTARWRRPAAREPLDGWSAGDEWKVDGTALSCAAGDPSYALWRGELPERYTVEVTLRLERFDDNGFLALVFGAGEGALQYFGVDGQGLVEIGRQTKEWKPLEPLGRVPPKKLEKLRFAIEVAPEKVAFFLDDRPVHERVYSPDELHGRIGLVMQNANARFEDLRVRY
jgi:tetratricopeptide (TPR) repeat protein